MARPWDDCRFFIISSCRNANCKFRHSEVAKSANTCVKWESGLCQNIECPDKHVTIKDKATIFCHFERLPQGCTNGDCPFKHLNSRNTEDIDLQKKLAQYLAEAENKHENTESNGTQILPKKNVVENIEIQPNRKRTASESSSESEEDLIEMRARILQEQVKLKSKTIVKKVKTEPKEQLKEQPKRETKTIEIKNIKIERQKSDQIVRRIIAKNEYSDDEDHSDISLDELTDEEPEDLRATLNKNKKVSSLDFDLSKRPGTNKRKITQKNAASNNARGGRIISILPNANLRKSEEERESSRPSSAEWIERKITVKQNNSRKIQNNPKIQNRLLASVKTNNKDSESEYSDTQSNGDDSPKPKRKPNLCCIKKRLGTKVEEKLVLSSRIDRFNDTGLVRVSSLKSRLGANSEPKRTVGVKSRLGEVRHSLRKPSADRSESDKEDEKIPSKRKKQILTQKKVEKTEEKNKKPKTEEKESKPEIIIEKAQKLRSDQNGAKETVVKKQTQQKIDNASSEITEVQKVQQPKSPSRKSPSRSTRKTSASSPRIRRQSGSKSAPKLSKTLDDFEKELLDDADNIYLDEDIDDDDLFDDL